MLCGAPSFLPPFPPPLPSREEDTSKTLYLKPTDHPDAAEGTPGSKETKVDTVCAALRKALMRMGENHYCLSIITSYVKMSQPDLESVLSMIMRLKGQNCCHPNHSVLS